MDGQRGPAGAPTSESGDEVSAIWGRPSDLRWWFAGIRGFALLLLTYLVSAPVLVWAIAPPFYSAKPVQATVVDEVSGSPLSGVIVVAIWQLKAISGLGPRLQVSETLTDHQGRFSIPGWGPRMRPPLTEFRRSSPRLVFFKRGYVPLVLYNESRREVEKAYPNYRTMSTRDLREATQWHEGTASDVVQESMWNGLTIQVEPFRGTPMEWFRHLRHVESQVEWEDTLNARQLYQTLLAERDYFRTNPVSPREVRPQRIEEFFLDIESRLQGKRK